MIQVREVDPGYEQKIPSATCIALASDTDFITITGFISSSEGHLYINIFYRKCWSDVLLQEMSIELLSMSYI